MVCSLIYRHCMTSGPGPFVLDLGIVTLELEMDHLLELVTCVKTLKLGKHLKVHEK